MNLGHGFTFFSIYAFSITIEIAKIVIAIVIAKLILDKIDGRR